MSFFFLIFSYRTPNPSVSHFRLIQRVIRICRAPESETPTPLTYFPNSHQPKYMTTHAFPFNEISTATTKKKKTKNNTQINKSNSFMYIFPVWLDIFDSVWIQCSLYRIGVQIHCCCFFAKAKRITNQSLGIAYYKYVIIRKYFKFLLVFYS